MIASLILLAILVAVGLPLWYLDRKKHPAGEDPEIIEPKQECTDDCCTTHDVCPSHELLTGLDEPAVYYDDEHLDRFLGRQASAYQPDEIDEWRDVLYTLLPADRMGWCKSLKKRGITMPSAIHDEFLMLLNEP
ncbi:MAG: phospholipase [Muribaculaceae bacterium]|nr:phospholipase [Muribaculaceae bacterium]